MRKRASKEQNQPTRLTPKPYLPIRRRGGPAVQESPDPTDYLRASGDGSRQLSLCSILDTLRRRLVHRKHYAVIERSKD
jgi:hypothetical protein